MKTCSICKYCKQFNPQSDRYTDEYMRNQCWMWLICTKKENKKYAVYSSVVLTHEVPFKEKLKCLEKEEIPTPNKTKGCFVW